METKEMGQETQEKALETIDYHTEFETKYRVDGGKIYEFKKIVGSLEGRKDFVYVEGPDHYYTKPRLFYIS